MRRNLLQALAVAGVLGVSAAEASAQQSDRDIAFSKKMNEVQLFDYSEYFLKKCIDANPSDVDRVRAQLADTYMQWNKSDDAMKIVAQIPETSPFYAQGQGVIGVAAAKKGNYALAIKALEKVMAYCEKNKGAVEELKEPLRWLQQAYQEEGKAEKVKKVMELLSVGQDPREATYYKIVAELDTAESMLEDELAAPDRAKPFLDKRKKRLEAFEKREELKKLKGKDKSAAEKLALLESVDYKDWQSIAIRAVYELEDLQWDGQSIVTAFSYSAIGRSYFMLGNYAEAQKALNMNPELLEACDEAFKKEKALGQSPSAFVKYWSGNVAFKLASMTDKNEDKIKYLKEALRAYAKLLVAYQGFPDASKAYGKLLKASDQLVALEPSMAKKVEEMKAKIPASQGSAADAAEDIVPGEIDQAFRDKRYPEVVKALLPIVREKRMSSGSPDALYKLAFAMVNNKQDLESMALCVYLASLYPKTQHASVALLQVSDVLWKAGKKDDALLLYELFLKIAPDHQFACEIAARVAQEYYNNAAALGTEANKMPAGEPKRKKTLEAIEAFKAVIPKYQRIIDGFGNRKEWVDKAYYMLAISFSSSRQFEAAADTYLKFCNSEPEDLTQVADAKMRAADSLFQAGQDYEKQAKELREQAYAMPSSKPDAKKDAPAEPAKADDAKKDAPAEPAKADAPEGAPAVAEAAPAANTREGKLAEAARLEKMGKNSYKEGIAHLKELMEDWLKDGGKLGKVVSDQKVQKTVEDTMQLLPWLYDAADEKKVYYAEVQKFIAKYPKNKSVPASMMRMGVIYTEIGDDKSAERILGELSTKFKDTNEGKNAKFYLARSLFNNQKYDKSVEIVGDLLHNKDLLANLNVQNLRWISSNLWNCGGQHPINAAKLALEAAEMLLGKLEKPDMKDWVGQQMALELASNEKDRLAMVNILRQRLQCEAGQAAYWSELYPKAVDYYTKVLKDDKTPLYFEAKFGRAEALVKMKDFDGGRADLGEASLRANTSGKFAIYDKAQCLIGDLGVEAKDYSKAFAAYNIIAIMSPDSSADEQIAAYVKTKTEAEKIEAQKEAQAALEWIEYAVYKTAFCSAKLGRTEDKAKMVEKYKKFFPSGRFAADIDKLPPPEAGNKP